MSNYRTVEHEIECVVDSRDKVGEGAFWCPEERAVYWLDVPLPSVLHRFLPQSGRHDTWPTPEMITAMAKRRDGTLLVASQGGLNIFDPGSGHLDRIATPEAHRPKNRSNDSAPDAKGRFWLGTMQNNLGPNGEEIPIEASSGGLWRIEPDLTATEAVTGLGITNGLAWSPDNTVLYVADTMIQTIFAYDFDLDSGTLSNKRVFSDVKDLGFADGATVDAEGYIWSARWEGSCIARLAPDGSVDRIVPTPSTRVTSCAFGDDDFGTLYFTTARLGVAGSVLQTYPMQGGLFAFRPGVTGLPRPQFAG